MGMIEAVADMAHGSLRIYHRSLLRTILLSEPLPLNY